MPGFKIKCCKLCEKSFKPSSPTQQYCKKCQYKNKLSINRRCRRKKPIEQKCIICNNFFFSSKIQHCCDKECRDKYKKQRDLVYYKEITKINNKHLDRGSSYPQRFIYNMLKQKFCQFVWKYNDRSIIKNPDTNYPMELDIWCPNLNLALEYDGEHHFDETIYGKKTFMYTKYLDNIKDHLCFNANITLIRISCKDNWKNKEWILNKIGDLLNANN